MKEVFEKNLVESDRDPLVRYLKKYVVWSVKLLAILMVFVIWLTMIDVVIHLYQKLAVPLVTFSNIENLIAILGDFLAVLIAIEIFLNIIFYLSKDSFHVPLVLATALTAVARKVIILDYKGLSPMHIFAIAAVIFAVGVVYWLITRENNKI